MRSFIFSLLRLLTHSTVGGALNDVVGRFGDLAVSRSADLSLRQDQPTGR
jgi:hypothetical protein